MNKKNQIWYFDFIMGVTIFTLILIIAFKFVTSNFYIPGKETNNVLSEAEKLSETLLTMGIPTNWTEDTVLIPGVVDKGNILNTTKLQYLINLTNKNSNKVKNLFGIKSDFLVYFEDKEGNVLWGFDNYKGNDTLENGLIAYYKLNNNDFSDELGNIDLLNSGTTNTAGIIGDGRESNGAGFLEAPDYDDFDVTGDLTISFWYSPNGQDDGEYIFMDDGWGIREEATASHGCSAGHKIAFVLVGKATVCNDGWTLNDSIYQHIAITHDSTTNEFKYYKNGVLGDTDINTNTLNVGSNGLHILSTTSESLIIDGKIDEIGIWNRALDLNEIGRLYNSGNGLAYPFATAQNLSSINDVKASNPEKLIALTRYVVYKHDGISEIIAMKVVLWQE